MHKIDIDFLIFFNFAINYSLVILLYFAKQHLFLHVTTNKGIGKKSSAAVSGYDNSSICMCWSLFLSISTQQRQASLWYPLLFYVRGHLTIALWFTAYFTLYVTLWMFLRWMLWLLKILFSCKWTLQPDWGASLTS